jgi:hypothetical protein
MFPDQPLNFSVHARRTLFPDSSGIVARAISSSSFGGWAASPASRASYQSVQTSQSSPASRSAALRICQWSAAQ